MTSYLLDTNHISKLLDGDQTLRQRLLAAQQRGDEVGISVTVLGELYFAAYFSQRQAQNLGRIEQLTDWLQIWQFNNDAAREFGVIRAEQRKKGRPIPPMDAQIAAVARLHGLTVVSADQHFTFVDRLATENWLEQETVSHLNWITRDSCASLLSPSRRPQSALGYRPRRSATSARPSFSSVSLVGLPVRRSQPIER